MAFPDGVDVGCPAGKKISFFRRRKKGGDIANASPDAIDIKFLDGNAVESVNDALPAAFIRCIGSALGDAVGFFGRDGDGLDFRVECHVIGRGERNLIERTVRIRAIGDRAVFAQKIIDGKIEFRKSCAV